MDKSIISVKNISKTYKLGDVTVKALDGLSLEIYEGEFVIITGRNGSGKSTLLHQIGLLDKPDSGMILLENEDVIELTEKKRTEIRLKKLGYIFQEYALATDLTAIENIMLPSLMLEKTRNSRQRAQEILEKIGLKKRINNLPRQLSGGEQQKVAIGRSLVNQPKILIADEPTANLDSIAAKDVLETFKNLNEKENYTIIMVTHEQEEIKYGTRVVTLSDGKIKSEDKNEK